MNPNMNVTITNSQFYVSLSLTWYFFLSYTVSLNLKKNKIVKLSLSMAWYKNKSRF